MFGKILIQKLLGSKSIYPNYILGKIKENFSTKKGKTTLIVGFFDGEYFQVSEKSSPGMVSILNSCNSMILVDEKIEKIEKDSYIKILPINWKFFSDIKKDFLTHE